MVYNNWEDAAGYVWSAHEVYVKLGEECHNMSLLLPLRLRILACRYTHK